MIREMKGVTTLTEAVTGVVILKEEVKGMDIQIEGQINTLEGINVKLMAEGMTEDII